MPFKRHPIYLRGDTKPSPFLLQDGIVKLYTESPYDGHIIVVDWIKPGDYFGEEFAFGQPAIFNALAVRNHTWAQDVQLPLHQVMDLAGKRMQTVVDVALATTMRQRFRIQFLFNLLNLPFPDIYQTEQLETCGKVTITARAMAHAYRKQGLFQQKGKKIVVPRPDLVADELEKVIEDAQKERKKAINKFYDQRHIRAVGPLDRKEY